MKWYVFATNGHTKFKPRDAYREVELSSLSDLQDCLEDFDKSNKDVIAFLDLENNNSTFLKPVEYSTYIPVRHMSFSDLSKRNFTDYDSHIAINYEGFILEFRNNTDAAKKIMQLYERKSPAKINLGDSRIDINNLHEMSKPTKLFLMPSMV
jgi:hypothetical protein